MLTGGAIAPAVEQIAPPSDRHLPPQSKAEVWLKLCSPETCRVMFSYTTQNRLLAYLTNQMGRKVGNTPFRPILATGISEIVQAISAAGRAGFGSRNVEIGCTFTELITCRLSKVGRKKVYCFHWSRI